jgi:ATP-dependent Clp protease ATP-binding subunit ClpX
MATSKERCSFCGKAKNEVKQNVLVAAGNDGPWICLKCIDESKRAVEEASRRDASNKEEPLKRPNEIKAYLDEFVIGQDRAKTDIALAVYNHYKRREILKRGGSISIDVDGQDEPVEIDKSNILLLGPSGTGKTHIARGIARMLKVPFYVADATRLTMSGYVGDDVETILQGLIADADQDLERAQWGIAFIDEFDKIARKSGRSASGYRDVTGEGVQQALLKLLEGSRVPVPRGMGSKVVVAGAGGSDMIDTTNILFIGAGSFAGIEECVERRVNRTASMGFGSHSRKRFDPLDKTSIYSQVTEEDILDFGMIPELIGRMPVLTSTYDLTEDEMIEVLTKPKNAIVKQFRAMAKMDNIDLQFDEGALRAVAREAKKRPTGARALRGILERVLQPITFQAPSDIGIAAIRITEEVVTGKGTPIYVRRDVKQTA